MMEQEALDPHSSMETKIQQYTDQTSMWKIKKPLKWFLHPREVQSQAYQILIGKLGVVYLVRTLHSVQYDWEETPNFHLLSREGKKWNARPISDS